MDQLKKYVLNVLIGDVAKLVVVAEALGVLKIF